VGDPVKFVDTDGFRSINDQARFIAQEAARCVAPTNMPEVYHMPADLFMIGVDWYGPFPSLRNARAASVKAGVSEFLYFAITTEGNDSAYVGLSKSVETRLTEGHHILGGLEDGDIDLWIGIVSSQTEAGRPSAQRPVSHSESVEIAEHVFAYFLQTSHNQRKRKSVPGRSAAVFGRCFQSLVSARAAVATADA
jgi:hypothetical protein